MTKKVWSKLVEKMEKEIVQEVISSLKVATGCHRSDCDDTEDVLYLNKSGEMFWTRDSRGTLSEKFFNGDAVILFTHTPEEMGCYGCRESKCSEFDKNPGLEVEFDVRKMDEIMGRIYMNIS